MQAEWDGVVSLNVLSGSSWEADEVMKVFICLQGLCKKPDGAMNEIKAKVLGD